MGILDIFRKNKSEEKNNEPVYNASDLSLRYNSGVEAQIKFGDVQDLGPEFNNKFAQQVFVTYITPDGRVQGKDYYVEPLYTQDQNGNSVWCTKEYYQGLVNDGNLSVVKGFFKLEELNDIERRDGTNYIGSLNVDSQGKFMRYYDENFRNRYVNHCRQEKARLQSEYSSRRKSESEQFREQLLKSVENGHYGYQSVCDNEYSRNRALQENKRKIYGETR